MSVKGTIIAIVGAPRSGKSFLAKKLAEYFNASIFLEGEEQDIPSRIREDIAKNIRPVERITWFRNRLVNNYLDADALRKEGKTVVMDTYWMSVAPYVPVLTTGFEADLCREMLDTDLRALSRPDVVILLENSPENSKKFIAAGGRAFDAHDSYITEYVIPTQKAHREYITEEKVGCPVLVIDRTELNFENAKDVEGVVQKIKDKLSKK